MSHLILTSLLTLALEVLPLEGSNELYYIFTVYILSGFRFHFIAMPFLYHLTLRVQRVQSDSTMNI